MAATDASHAGLRALTAAALALPGLASSSARAAGSEGVSVQHARYREGERDLFGVKSLFDPIEVDSLDARASLGFFDRIRLDGHFQQDTWSGATPIATAPQPLRGNRPTAPDGISGATPFIEGSLYFDSELTPLESDGSGGFREIPNRQLVHTLSSASPETRRQLDFDLGYEWNDASASIGGGLSHEDDFESRFVEVAGSLDLDQKRTTLDFGLSYTHSDSDATLDHDASPYIDTSAFRAQIENQGLGVRVLHGSREDWSAQLGWTRILNRSSLLEVSVGFARATGALENPYKVVEVAFLDPDQQFLAPPGGFYGRVHALLEQRPDVRNQWSAGARLVQQVERFGAAASLGYRYHHDDWGIDAHRFEADWRQPLGHGFSLTPRIRYYSQSAADFYTPYLVSAQAFETIVVDDEGNLVSITRYDPRLLPGRYSSDHRLSAFGALSGGLTLAKQFENGLSLEADFEYYSHGGSLKLGGGGEGSYADFDYYVLSGVLRVDMQAWMLAAERAEHAHAEHTGARAPAGVMSSQMLGRAGDFMLGYRFLFGRQDGNLLRGSRSAGDAELVNLGCGSQLCGSAPERMDMFMHMLELMVAPTDWLNLMLMPSFVDMDMELRQLAGGPIDAHSGHTHHSSGGIGDVTGTALVRLFDRPGHHLHLGLGISAPTGDVGVKVRRSHQEDLGYLHYGMQLGSGTWDLLPSATYTGRAQRLSWGAQLSGVKRLERENPSGYALGDVLQATAWGSVDLTAWLSASLRGAYTRQGEIVREFDGPHLESSPPDQPGNQGGQFWDIGIGLGVVVPLGAFSGNRLALEWLQPVSDDVRGYQLERVGALYLSWSLGF